MEEDEEELLGTLALPTDEAEEEHREGSGMSFSYSNEAMIYHRLEAPVWIILADR